MTVSRSLPRALRRGASWPIDLVWALRECVLLLAELVVDAALAGVHRVQAHRARAMARPRR